MKSNRVAPLPDGTAYSGETDPFDRGFIQNRYMLHHPSYAVVGDGLHYDLFADHLGGFTAQNIHPHLDFHIAKEHLDRPALEIHTSQRTDRTAEKPFGCVGENGGDLFIHTVYILNIQTSTTRNEIMKKKILAQRPKEFEPLEKQLHSLPLLAQGSVFAIAPPPGAPRASTHYTWTRKVNNKTVTKALSKDQYEALKKAIRANRQVEKTLRRMRSISQDAILEPLSDSNRKPKSKKRPKPTFA